MSIPADKNFLAKLALAYHSDGRPGKIEVKPTKPYHTQRDLSLAYTPGVAVPCLEIQKNPDDVYKYTAKGNLVAVISNGTAVLGLGDIGAMAGKPVMEGKGLLFKIYADVDVFDIEVDEKDPEKLIQIIKAIAPTFGGINLEDIKAPECFEIEDRLKEELDIPLMHDDQHGTAIITSAGLLNALEITGKDISTIRIVVNGAGAAAVSCIKLYVKLGANPQNIIMFDSKGMLHTDRKDINKTKQQFAHDGMVFTLEEALDGADMFLGLSVAGVLKKEWLRKMAPRPIVFALANPVPEITYDEATSTRDDIVMATGRSDFPNQINNVLGFPFIFRGALDVKASKINDEMKLAAALALAELAKEPTPEEVNRAYNVTNLKFGSDYIIPKPNDPRLILRVAPAVARAAIETGVARAPITDWNQYQEELSKRMGLGSPIIRQIKAKAQSDPKSIVFAEAENYKILKAAEIALQEGIAHPILLGNESRIRKMIQEHELELEEVEIIDPRSEKEKERRMGFARHFHEKRRRKGVTLQVACERMHHRNYFGPMLVESGYADGMVSGLTTSYPDTIRPALQIIGKQDRWKIVSGMYMLNTGKGQLFFADTTVNMNPEPEILVEIALQVSEAVRNFGIEPRVALISYSNFGSVKGAIPQKVQQAAALLHKHHPDLIADGDIQADFALNSEMIREYFPWSKLANAPANVFIFPYLTAGNAAYKLVQQLTDQDAIGPVLLGLRKPVHILQMGSTVNNIVNMVSLAAIDAQRLKGH